MISAGYLIKVRGNISGDVAAGITGMFYLAVVALLLFAHAIFLGRGSVRNMAHHLVGYALGVFATFFLLIIIYPVLNITLSWFFEACVINFIGAIVSIILAIKIYSFL